MKLQEEQLEKLITIQDVLKQSIVSYPFIDNKESKYNFVLTQLSASIPHLINNIINLIEIQKEILESDVVTFNNVLLILQISSIKFEFGNYKFVPQIISETELPENLTKQEYGVWYEFSQIQNGVRIGLKLELINAK